MIVELEVRTTTSPDQKYMLPINILVSQGHQKLTLAVNIGRKGISIPLQVQELKSKSLHIL